MGIFKTLASMTNFVLGFNPKIERQKDKFLFPPPYKAVCLISADFELGWAFRYSKSEPEPMRKAERKAKNARTNIPQILALCEQYALPITWATVGHLFLNECVKKNGIAHPDLPRVPYFETEFWKYKDGDWFDCDPCSLDSAESFWFAPDLIEEILKKGRHEIGCHTFSHIPCYEHICPEPVFEAEVERCRAEAEKRGLTLKSFVHPGHGVGHLKKLAEMNFTSYRTDIKDTLALPKKDSSGLWQLRNTAELCYRDGFPLAYQIWRYKMIIDRAIKYRKLCVFWFHPSLDERAVKYILPAVWAYLAQKRDEILVSTTADYIDFLNKQDI